MLTDGPDWLKLAATPHAEDAWHRVDYQQDVAWTKYQFLGLGCGVVIPLERWSDAPKALDPPVSERCVPCQHWYAEEVEAVNATVERMVTAWGGTQEAKE